MTEKKSKGKYSTQTWKESAVVSCMLIPIISLLLIFPVVILLDQIQNYLLGNPVSADPFIIIWLLMAIPTLIWTVGKLIRVARHSWIQYSHQSKEHLRMTQLGLSEQAEDNNSITVEDMLYLLDDDSPEEKMKR